MLRINSYRPLSLALGYSIVQMGFLAWIRQIQYVLHECAESIRDAKASNKEQHLPPDKPLEVRAIVSYDELTVRNARGDSERSHSTQDSIKKATWYAFVAVTVYALVTLLMWFQMIKQSRIANAALRQSTESFRIDERAWIEFENVELKQLKFPPQWHGGQPIYLAATLKNYGKTEARNLMLHANTRGVSDHQDTKDVIANFLSKEALLPERIQYILAPAADTQISKTGGLLQLPHEVFGHVISSDYVGRIEYDDTFGIHHWRTFCYELLPDGTFVACESGNDEDQNKELLPN